METGFILVDLPTLVGAWGLLEITPHKSIYLDRLVSCPTLSSGITSSFCDP